MPTHHTIYHCPLVGVCVCVHCHSYLCMSGQSNDNYSRKNNPNNNKHLLVLRNIWIDCYYKHLHYQNVPMVPCMYDKTCVLYYCIVNVSTYLVVITPALLLLCDSIKVSLYSKNSSRRTATHSFVSQSLVMPTNSATKSASGKVCFRLVNNLNLEANLTLEV